MQVKFVELFDRHCLFQVNVAGDGPTVLTRTREVIFDVRLKASDFLENFGGEVIRRKLAEDKRCEGIV